MKVLWKLSIGFPGAIKRGTLEIPDDELEGKSDADRDDYISDAVYEHATQHVDTSWEIDE